MSFASRIKEELVRQRVREPRLKNAQLSGLTFACGSLKLGRWYSPLGSVQVPQPRKHPRTKARAASSSFINP